MFSSQGIRQDAVVRIGIILIILLRPHPPNLQSIFRIKQKKMPNISDKAAACHPHKHKSQRDWLFWSSFSPKRWRKHAASFVSDFKLPVVPRIFWRWAWVLVFSYTDFYWTKSKTWMPGLFTIYRGKPVHLRFMQMTRKAHVPFVRFALIYIESGTSLTIGVGLRTGRKK